jgi:hypothetical protein
MRARKRIRGLRGVLVLVVLAACESPGEDRGEPGPRDAPAAGPERPGTPPPRPADRPAERMIPVELEGFEEEVRFVLYRSPAGYPLPFSTYIPSDMVAEEVASGEGLAIRMVAAFGGLRNEGAAVHMIVHREGATEAEAVGVLREIAAGLGTELVEAEQEESFAWSIRDFRNVALPSRLDATEGTMALGRRGGRLFSLVIHYPAEYGDGFGPRSRQILQEWRWEDTGEPLLGRERGANGWG